MTRGPTCAIVWAPLRRLWRMTDGPGVVRRRRVVRSACRDGEPPGAARTTGGSTARTACEWDRDRADATRRRKPIAPRAHPRGALLGPARAAPRGARNAGP